MDSVGPATFPRSLLKAARSVSFSVADITRGIAHYSRRLIVLTPHRGSVASAFATPLLRPPPLFLSGSFFFFFRCRGILFQVLLEKMFYHLLYHRAIICYFIFYLSTFCLYIFIFYGCLFCDTRFRKYQFLIFSFVTCCLTGSYETFIYLSFLIQNVYCS